MLFAALLNRTLLVSLDPKSVENGYDRRLMFDIDYARACLGPNTIMTTQEYQIRFNKTPAVDAVRCWRVQSCPIHDIESDSIESAFKGVEDFRFVRNVKVTLTPLKSNTALLEDFLEQYGSVNGSILMMGDAYGTHLNHSLAKIGDGPFVRTDKCAAALFIRPSAVISDSGRAFLEELGLWERGDFIGVHWRRGDFFEVCKRGGRKECYHPIPQIAQTILRKIETTNLRTIFLATDANPFEV